LTAAYQPSQVFKNIVHVLGSQNLHNLGKKVDAFHYSNKGTYDTCKHHMDVSQLWIWDFQWARQDATEIWNLSNACQLLKSDTCIDWGCNTDTNKIIRKTRLRIKECVSFGNIQPVEGSEWFYRTTQNETSNNSGKYGGKYRMCKWLVKAFQA